VRRRLFLLVSMLSSSVVVLVVAAAALELRRRGRASQRTSPAAACALLLMARVPVAVAVAVGWRSRRCARPTAAHIFKRKREERRGTTSMRANVNEERGDCSRQSWDHKDARTHVCPTRV